ncbi:MAG: thiopeptide-type bacteriocin biosynthesis protein [Bacteroidales bacterium]|jgi:thiopeptide-type bacteriocin biosynthesis protein
MNIPKRKFPPGSEWLYLKIYGGPQSLEEWMTGTLRVFLPVWRASGLISSFHYIHYLDPDYHLRLRLLLTDPLNSGILLNEIQRSSTKLLDDDLLWKMETCTYEPEYERYGMIRMSLVEAWFEMDSVYWLEEIKNHSDAGDSDIWKSALVSVDVFLDDFGATIDDKRHTVNELKKSAFAFVRLSKVMRVQLDEKYRTLSKELNFLMAAPGRTANLDLRSVDSEPIISALWESFADRESLWGSDLAANLIHMSLNRAFRTRHRLQELVIYDFLSRYYESVIARGKNVKREV